MNSNIIQTLTKGIVIALVGLGFLSGLAVSQSDLANPWTGQAKADQMRTEMSRQQAINEIDTQYYEQERAWQSQATEAKIKEDIAFYKRQHEQALRLQKWAGIAAIVLGSVTAYGALALVFIFFWNRFFKMVNAKDEALAQAAPIGSPRQPVYNEFTPLTLRRQPAPTHRHNNGRMPQTRVQG
ncbi:MAG: hypothetical protein IAE79_03380 [Anaerolinea sp.]|nr:hypothetical protein [Anaerolinea sp.]